MDNNFQDWINRIEEGTAYWSNKNQLPTRLAIITGITSFSFINSIVTKRSTFDKIVGFIIRRELLSMLPIYQKITPFNKMEIQGRNNNNHY